MCAACESMSWLAAFANLCLRVLHGSRVLVCMYMCGCEEMNGVWFVAQGYKVSAVTVLFIH